MGQQQPIKKAHKKRSSQEEARIEGLYEMYAQSIRVSTMIKDQSLYEQSFEEEVKRRQMKKRKFIENGENFLKGLLDSFDERNQYAWGSEISKLFMKHFSQGFEAKWYQSKEFFYELLLQNSGIQPQSHQLVVRSHLIVSEKEKKLKQLHKVNNKNDNKKENLNSFENYFLKIIKERNNLGGSIKSSFAMIEQDDIDRRKEEEIAEIAQVESQRMTIEQEINFINSSIIDAEQEKIFSSVCYTKQQNSKQNQKNPHPHQTRQQNDDQYFLPLITKRHKSKKPPKQAPTLFQQPLIQMSQFESKAKYSRYRLQSSSVIIPSTVFYERMNFTAKVETDQFLRIYRQLSNTIQQTINSCNLISCPLKHFLLYFQFKTSKKNINMLNHSVTQSKLLKTNSNDQNITSPMKSQNSTSSPTKSPSTSTLSSPLKTHKRSLSSTSSPTHDLYHLLTQTSQKSEIIRKKRQYNTNYLLKQIRQFTEAYTEFLFKYLNFSKIQQSDLQNFINIDTVYGIVLRNIWNIVSWIADRGYQWEEFVIRDVVIKESEILQVFTQEQVLKDPLIIIQSYAKFSGKDMRKIKIQPNKFTKAYLSLLKLKNEVFPQKYLKKIIIFYRQATKCCEGADDLMSLYEFLLKNCILNGFTQEMHIFRMKNIIEKLIPIESSTIDGAGEIVYAWTTWNIILEMFLLKLNDHKQELMLEKEKKQRKKLSAYQTEKKISPSSNQQKKPLSDNKQISQASNQKSQPTEHPNPQKRPIKKLQY